MKFERTIINPNEGEVKDMPVVEVPVAEVPVEKPVIEDAVPVAAVAEETVPEVKEKAEEIAEEISVAKPLEDKEPKEESVKESLEDKYKIPEFEPKVARAGVSYFTRVCNKTESTVSINAQDVKKVEAVDEVPASANVVDGVNLVGDRGDRAPEVEEQLKSVAEPAKGEEIPTQTATAVVTSEEGVKEEVSTEPDNNVSGGADKVEEADEATEEPVEEKVSTESEVTDEVTEEVKEPISEKVEEEKTEECGAELSKEAWDKFVDNVIVPTLATCIDRFKNYLVTVIAKDLKDSGPTK